MKWTSGKIRKRRGALLISPLLISLRGHNPHIEGVAYDENNGHTKEYAQQVPGHALKHLLSPLVPGDPQIFHGF